MTVTIWHNPRCSKSRQTLALLESNGITPNVRLYLQDPPTLEELQSVQQTLAIPAIGFMRTGEAAFKELGLSKQADDAALLGAMATHPALIERPIVFHDGKAAVGRPPEAVLSIL
ncbi:MAG: arsenate reductase (glutaredoxin) [Marinosulfonomonas sp.]|nr:arsenate reductase (glutaredoxin) [Marinosulfonomonas sp.]